MRSLSPEESALWARVASTIRPLSREKAIVDAPKLAAAHVARPKPQAVARPHVGPSPAPRPIEARTLDGSWDRRLAGGSIDPDRLIDLHGLSLDKAWQAIDSGLERAIACGERVILLVTGHHRPGEPPIRRGAIRAAVHDWLAASRHAGDIAAVRGAHRRHGGGGSLYIVLRRRR